jgi:hypothetical protein
MSVMVGPGDCDEKGKESESRETDSRERSRLSPRLLEHVIRLAFPLGLFIRPQAERCYVHAP